MLLAELHVMWRGSGRWLCLFPSPLGVHIRGRSHRIPACHACHCRCRCCRCCRCTTSTLMPAPPLPPRSVYNTSLRSFNEEFDFVPNRHDG